MLGFLDLEVLEYDVVICLVGFLGDAELEICLLLCFGHLKLYAAGLVEQFSVLIFNFQQIRRQSSIFSGVKFVGVFNFM